MVSLKISKTFKISNILSPIGGVLNRIWFAFNVLKYSTPSPKPEDYHLQLVCGNLHQADAGSWHCQLCHSVSNLRIICISLRRSLTPTYMKDTVCCKKYTYLPLMIITKYISYHSQGKTHALVPHTKIPLTLHICPPKKTVNLTQHIILWYMIYDICPPPCWRSSSPEGIPGCKSEERLRPQHSAAPRSGSHLQKYLFIFTQSNDGSHLQNIFLFLLDPVICATNWCKFLCFHSLKLGGQLNLEGNIGQPEIWYNNVFGVV